MRRTALLYALPAALVIAGWLRVEDGRAAAGQGLWLALLALAPALVGGRWRRLAVAVVSSLLAANTAFSVSIFDARPFDGKHDFVGPLLSRFWHGTLDFYDVQLPFDRDAHELMHGAVLVAIFGFCLVLALAIAERRVLLGVFALVVGAGWPATLLSGPGDLRRGALILVGVLWLLVGLRRPATRALRQPVLAGAAVVTLAVAASSSAAVAKGGFLDWRHWDFYNRPDTQVSVHYVWNSDYGGIHFPKKTTTVFRVKASPASLYWRATTLDAVIGGRWIEDPVFVQSTATGGPDVRSDLLLPRPAAARSHWVEEDVTVAALSDTRIPGGSVPVAYELDFPNQVQYTRDGGAVLSSDLERDQRYRVWSYAPRATPAQLARSKPMYPRQIADERRFLTVEGGTTVPPFGAPQREALMVEFFRAHAGDARIRPYAALYAKARSVVGRPRSPYAAVVALESWFRAGGSFRYEEHPRVARGTPPLVDFVLRSRAGYCQHFAGALALMLRYLGIPARVAAGFTSGQYDPRKSTWTVTDHNAHMWVEVWFRGFGWLPFDPTPGRGRLGAAYTAASASFDATGAARAVAGNGGSTKGAAARLHRLGLLRGGAPSERPEALTGGGTAHRRGIGLLGLLALTCLVAAALIGIVKLIRRRGRYLTRDPRRISRACRLELVEFLRDQGVEIPASATLGECGEVIQAELAVDARAFVEAASEARFGPSQLAVEASRRSRHELRKLRRRVRGKLGRLEKLRGFVSLRSLGLAG